MVMQRLATPTQYEPALEGLNDIRPLQLVEDSKIVVAYPVLCKNPPTIDKPAVGKLARCTQQGTLVRHKVNGLTAYEYIEQEFPVNGGNQQIAFSQKVSYISVVEVDVGFRDDSWFMDSTYTHQLARIVGVNQLQFPFVGTVFYVTVRWSLPFGSIHLGFYGYY